MLRKNEKDFLQAAISGDFNHVKAQLDAEINIELFDQKTGSRALMYAATNGHLNIVKLLIDKGADINATNHFNRSALSYACIMGQEDIAMYLTAKGANLNQNDQYNNSLLMLCSHMGLCQFGQKLIDHGLQLDQINHSQKTALLMAQDAKQPHFMTLLQNAENTALQTLRKSVGQKLSLRRRR